MTLRIGITGGIGSGKTTVCQIFEAVGAPVYYADYWAKWLLDNDDALKNGVLAIFGPQAYDAEGKYDRQYIASIVFEQPNQLAALNALVHPAVEVHSQNWHLEFAQRNVPYTLKEAALLIESGSAAQLDILVVVTAPEAVRIQRVMERDGFSEAAVRSRIARQMPEDQKAQHADHIIINDGQHALVPQIWALHQLWTNNTTAASLAF